MLTKDQIFVLKTYYVTPSYRRVKETFHTEFSNSATTLSDFSILWLVRKFEEAGSVQDKPWKERLHMATTAEHAKEVCELDAQNPHTSTCQLATCVKTSFCTVFRISLAQ